MTSSACLVDGNSKNTVFELTSVHEVGMIEWLTETAGFNWTKVLIGLGLFIITFVGSIALVSFLLVRIPADYFSDSFRGDTQTGNSVWCWTAWLGRNLLGVLLVAAGAIMSLPGIPGQGILMILLGIMLTDFPGKHRLARWLLGFPKLLESVNRLRQRYGKAPLVLKG